MDNASWRETQRSANVQKHREEVKKEEEELANRGQKSDQSFVRNQLLKAADAGTVEKRIQANKHNIQRGHSSMTENFARR